MNMEKLPKLLVSKSTPKKQVPYAFAGAYLIKMFNKDEKDSYEVKSETGEAFKLYIPTRMINNQIDANPTTGIILTAEGDTCFSTGDKIVVEQNVFYTDNKSDRDLNVFMRDENGEPIFVAYNHEIHFKINEEDGSYEPRKFNLICEHIKTDEGVEESTTIKGFVSLEKERPTYRRDIVRVKKVWKGCTEYKEGDYILIQQAGDWRVRYNGEYVVKVDTSNNDVIAIVDSPKWSNPSIPNDFD